MTPELKTLYPVPKYITASGDPNAGYETSWVVNAVKHAISSAEPKTRYTTTPTGTMLYVMSLLLPDRMFEAMINKKLGA